MQANSVRQVAYHCFIVPSADWSWTGRGHLESGAFCTRYLTGKNSLRRFRKINCPGSGTHRGTAKGSLIKKRQITSEGCFAHVIPIDFRFQRLDGAAVVRLKVVLGNVVQHLFFVSKRRGLPPP